MPARTLRLVPWSRQEEWEDVFTWLYADDSPDSVHLRERGVKRVKAWTSRGKVPHSVDSTAALVQVWLRDGCGGAYGPSALSEHEIRLMYTMAFIRFVNGVVDANQRGMYAVSVANIAEQLGLPGWFVDLRHAGTHDRLPSLTLLRAGCQQALQWLHTNYWVLQKTYLADTASEVRSLLTRYKNLRKQSAKGKANVAEAEAEEIMNEIVALTTTDTFGEILIPILLDVGFLIPSGKKKRATASNMSLPDTLLQMWSPTLSRFEQAWPGFAEELLVMMVDSLGEAAGAVSVPDSITSTDDVISSIAPSSSHQATIAAWAMHLLDQFILTQPTGWEGVLEACLRKPNSYTRIFVQRFAEAIPSITEKLAPFISYMDARLSESKEQSKSGSKAQSTTTTLAESGPMMEKLEHLHQRVEAFKKASVIDDIQDASPVALPETDETVDTAWTLYPAKDWRPCPIGCLPGGVFPNLDLPDAFDDGAYLEAKGIIQVPVYTPREEDAEEFAGGIDSNELLGGIEGGDEDRQDDMDVDEPLPDPDITPTVGRIVLL